VDAPRGLTRQHLDALREAGRPARYEKGQALCRQGEHSDSLVILTSGWVKVVAGSPDGGEVVLAVRGPDELVGDLAAVEGRESVRSASVIALDVVRCHVLWGEDFRTFLVSHGDTALALLQTIARRLRDADRRRVEYGTYDTTHRLALMLVELAAAHGRPCPDGIELTLSLTQDELAGLVAASRESVARALGGLRRLGLVSTSRRGVVVHDLEALTAFAG
jgi:CRP/FNR family transcriptional regulator, cyclic AMP receptor protein